MKKLNAILDRCRKAINELRNPYPRIAGSCHQCGKCCRSVILTYHGKPVMKIKEYRKLLRWDPEVYARFVLDSNQTENTPLTFSCSFQEGNICTVHDSRPLICRTYPHQSIFKLGAVLEEGCGYRLVQKGSFEDILSDVLESQK